MDDALAHYVENPSAPDPPVKLIRELRDYLSTYMDSEQVEQVNQAYLFGAQAHAGQTRVSGEPYIHHPLAVAKILAEMRMDSKGIMAGILHDVIEDTATAKDQLAERFGDDVANLVDGVSKLTRIKFRSRAEEQAENFRKMLLAMTRDIRVILIKLADRLHNMRTLGVMPPKKRRRIARETLEIYAPIANRLGMNGIRRELQALGFAAYYPFRCRVMDNRLREARGKRHKFIDKIRTAVERRLRQEGIAAQVHGWEQPLYAIYKKMEQGSLSLSEVFDVYTLRVIVDNVAACYQVLGAMHNLYKPVPRRFEDFIALPKPNGYQSLHTTLFENHGISMEVQIRTEEMDDVAESGIATRWLYGSGHNMSADVQERTREWVQNVLEMQQGAGDSIEFIENVKMDLFPEDVYVSSPKGEIKALPKGATVVDFAYAIHTDVGNTCAAAKVDRRYVALNTRLSSGQAVEVITRPGAQPDPFWLHFAVTGKARANIRAHLKRLERVQAVDLGKRMLDGELASFGLSSTNLSGQQLEELLAEYQLADANDLFAEIAMGRRMALLVAQRLARTEEETIRIDTAAEEEFQRPITLKGTERTVVTFAKCCAPIPGDRIIGAFHPGKGLVVHAHTCSNIKDTRKAPNTALDASKNATRWIAAQWADKVEGEFQAGVAVEVDNRRGALATIAAAIAEAGSNIEHLSMEDRDGAISFLNFTVAVSNRDHLARVMRRIKAIRTVLRIYRPKG